MMFVYLLATALLSFGFQFSDESKEGFFQRGGNENALNHMECIINMTQDEVFRIKRSELIPERCEALENGTTQISVTNPKWAVLVDYTLPSTKRRLFLFNLDGTRPKPVVNFYVSHGRFGDTPRNNTTPTEEGNTIRDISLYSNVPGSNASASGFHITGHSYIGRYSGISGKERSLVVHGLERDINDNSCDRAVVMHGNGSVIESGSQAGVNRMSSGCWMVDYQWVTELTRRLQGSPDNARVGGVPFFVYSPREAALPEDYYCSEKAAETVLFD